MMRQLVVWILMFAATPLLGAGYPGSAWSAEGTLTYVGFDHSTTYGDFWIVKIRLGEDQFLDAICVEAMIEVCDDLVDDPFIWGTTQLRLSGSLDNELGLAGPPTDSVRAAVLIVEEIVVRFNIIRSETE